jgi:hypothetical protein
MAGKLKPPDVQREAQPGKCADGDGLFSLLRAPRHGFSLAVLAHLTERACSMPWHAVRRRRVGVSGLSGHVQVASFRGCVATRRLQGTEDSR